VKAAVARASALALAFVVAAPAGQAQERLAPAPALIQPAPAPALIQPAPAPALIQPAPAPALIQPAPAPAPPELAYNLWVDATLTAAALGWWLGSELARPQIAPATCRWCDPPAFDASVRDALRWPATDVATVLSYVTATLQPALMFGMDAFAARRVGPPRNAWVDALLIAEATTIAMSINQIVKLAVGRERPFVHDLPEDAKPRTANPSDNNLSFYSAHTGLTFAVAASAGTIATMRRYRLAPWIWTVGLAGAAVTGYLRIAADRHYATDVAVGAVMGSLVGAGVPYLFHRPRQMTVAPMPIAGGLTLAVSGVF
jgi:membrane-associated phospholipid phosphatase